MKIEQVRSMYREAIRFNDFREIVRLKKIAGFHQYSL